MKCCIWQCCGRTVCFFLCFAAFSAAGQGNAPPVVEVSAEHPFLLFEDRNQFDVTPEQYSAEALEHWRSLPEALRPYSALVVDWSKSADPVGWFARFGPLLQESGVPLVLRIEPPGSVALDQLESVLSGYTSVRGIELRGLDFNHYPPPPAEELSVPEIARWTADAIGLAASYGRMVHLPVAGLGWARMMTNIQYVPLYERFIECQAHVIPSALYRGPQNIVAQSAVLGLGLEGAARQWGVAADGRWYNDAHFLTLGEVGVPPTELNCPPSLYRAILLTAAMTGSSVMAVGPEEALWFGSAPQYWNEAILPTLLELIENSLIARPDFVAKQATVAYQLAAANTPPAFHENLRDIDPVFDYGLLQLAVYGVQDAAQSPELILNRHEHFWIPLLSAHGAEAAAGKFSTVLRPGQFNSVTAWQDFLSAFTQENGGGDAFVSRVGRAIFVMNSKENSRETQAFRLEDVPAPVRGLALRRQDTAVVLEWPFREGDLSYTVYRRSWPDGRFEQLGAGVEERSYIDLGPPADISVAYAVSALTNEVENYAGAVAQGEYLALSTVKSRIAEEAVLHPVLTVAQGQPLEENAVVEIEVEAPDALPPSLQELDAEQQALGLAILQRLDYWKSALEDEDLQGLLALYSSEYKDAEGWGFEYLRRAYQWFLERCLAPRMQRQIRRWDFSGFAETSQVNMLLYCRIRGVALSDPFGRVADLPVEFPRTETMETWITWRLEEGVWKISGSNPALPNFRDLLSYTASPYAPLPPGPDFYSP